MHLSVRILPQFQNCELFIKLKFDFTVWSWKVKIDDGINFNNRDAVVGPPRKFEYHA